MTLTLVDALTADPGDPTGDPVSGAVIRNVYADGTVDLTYLGGVAANVRVLAWYVPRSGDVVEVMRRNDSTLLVLGPTRTSNPTTVDIDSSLGLAYNVDPALTPSLPNPLTVDVAATKSFRGGTWERDAVYQGASATQYGYWRGLYFYGTVPQQLAGRRVTRIRIRISRDSTGGVIANVAQWLAPHIHPSQPPSSPIFTEGARSIGVATRSTPVLLDLPVEWGQQLVDGNVKGFGHIRDTTGDYSIAKSRTDDAATGELTIDWA